MSIDWASLSQTLPPLIFLSVFMIFAGMVAFSGINKRDQTMTKILSDLLKQQAESQERQQDNFVDALKSVTDPLENVTSSIDSFKEQNGKQVELLKDIKSGVDSLQRRQQEELNNRLARLEQIAENSKSKSVFNQ